MSPNLGQESQFGICAIPFGSHTCTITQSVFVMCKYYAIVPFWDSSPNWGVTPSNVSLQRTYSIPPNIAHKTKSDAFKYVLCHFGTVITTMKDTV